MQPLVIALIGTLQCFPLATASWAGVLFYGGDYDGRIGAPSQWAPNLQTLVFDDFILKQRSTLESIWGNFGLLQTVDYFIPTEARCEIRSGVSAGNGGALWYSGTLSVQATPTGRFQYGLPEYQILAHLHLTLPAGTYWLGMAPIGGSIWDEAYVSSTSGGSDGTPGDPNPSTTGSPIADGNSYFYGPVGYPYVPMGLTTAGPEIWDFSYGVSGHVDTPPTVTCDVGSIIECGSVTKASVLVSDPDADNLAVVWSLNGAPVQTNAVAGNNSVGGTSVSFSAVLPLGTNILTVTAFDTDGNSASCSSVVIVVDTTPPLIQSVSAHPDVLWPPNHRIVPVQIEVQATDNCGPTASKIVAVTSNEPTVEGRDWIITGNLTVALRADRFGQGEGRTYTILVVCDDTAGNSSFSSVTVGVPHDKAR